MRTRTVFDRRLSGRVIGGVVAAAVVLVLVVAGGIYLVLGRDSKTTTTSTPSSVSFPTSSSTVPGTTTAVDPTALAKQFRVGAWAGTSNDQTAPARIKAFGSLQSSLNVNLSIVHVYKGQMTMPIGGPVDQQAVKAGKTLLISWAGGDTKEMVAGKYDALIAQRAREVAALKVPVFFQYRWEMDRPNLQASTVHSPADYIAAWKHVRTIFAQQKVTNAEFVWCPLAEGFTAANAHRAEAYYPGDDSVDWLCADLYPTGAPQESFATAAAPFLAWANPHQKPIMFGEFGVPKSYGAKRAAWLAAIKSVVVANPRIRALVYFNAVGTNRDYSVSDDIRSLDALGALGRSLGVKAAR